MAEPLSGPQWRAALRDEGVRVTYRDNWLTHNRNHMGEWGDVNGAMIHHTAGTDSLSTVVNGTGDLPGPLCTALLKKSGEIVMISHGRTNHAGKGRRRVFEGVLADRAFTASGPDEIDGNAHFYGLEIENRGNGSDPYPEAQYDAAVRWAAAICRARRWKKYSLVGHKEWTGRKIDPFGTVTGYGTRGRFTFTMDMFRLDVNERLAHGASWSPPQAPSTTPPDDEDKPVTEPKTFTDVVEHDGIPSPRNAATHESNPTWTLATYVRDIAEGVRRLEAAQEAHHAAVQSQLAAMRAEILAEVRGQSS